MKVSTVILAATAIILAVLSVFFYSELDKARSAEDALKAENSRLTTAISQKEQEQAEQANQAKQTEEQLKATLAEKDKTIQDQLVSINEMASFKAQLPKVLVEGPVQEGWRAALQEQGKLVDYLDHELKDTGMTVYRQDPYVIVQVPESTFSPGSSHTTKELIKGLTVVAEVFNAYKGDYLLSIEGHTDNVPVNKRYDSNWELGAARATSVINKLIALGVKPETLALVSRSQYLPINPHNDPTSDPSNRRVELVFAPRRVVQKPDLKAQADVAPANATNAATEIPPSDATAPANIETAPAKTP